MKLKDLPDYVALERLAKSLWRDGETRGAALLIGAGFSRFARLPGEDAKTPPLWPDLKSRMVAQIYPGAPESVVPADPLRLAEEYRAMFGQAALDDFIREQVPDFSWEPGELHERLLRLPWADVLTTNWDTLLERTAPSISESNYETVTVVTDIASARQPRIIKLHGSLPSGPFVFAEEDYRTYPTKHAAFVNLARQIFLENELCLIGFSGNDPNFLQWSGWVRDHLGGGARRIYLVGVLNLPLAARRLLESRNVVPVDLARLVADIDGPERHAKAIELFLEFLQEAEPRPIHAWPPEPPPQAQTTAADHERLFKDKAFAADKLVEAAARWRIERESYPGWLVCPAEKRWAIRHRTDDVSIRKDVLDQLAPHDRAKILFELAWRFDKAFWPIPDFLFDAMFAAFHDVSSPITRGERLEFGIILLRGARESDKTAQFDKLADTLHSLSAPDTDVRAAIAYQRCLLLRDRLQFSKLWKQAEDIRGPDPMWKLRQANIRAELGDDEIAKELIIATSSELRSRQQRDRRSIWVLSRRAWAEYLSRIVDRDIRTRANTRRYERERGWPLDYKVAKCDPWDELHHADSEIDKAVREELKDTFDVKPHFDAGTFTEAGEGIRFRSWTSVPPNYEFERLAEEAALPLLLDWTSVRANYAKKALPLAFTPTEPWYCRLLQTVHSHSDELLERYLDRIAVARLRREIIDVLVDRSQKAIEFWRQKRDVSNGKSSLSIHAIEEVRLFIEVLSRLVIRLSSERAKEMWDFGYDLVKDRGLAHWWLLEPISHLMQRAAEAIPPLKRAELTLAAIQFPLRAESGFGGVEHHWPTPIIYLKDCKLVRAGNAAAWTIRVGELISAVAASQKDGRGEASMRLCMLEEQGLLTDDERAAFGNALYAHVDSKSGMPLDTNFYPFVFLRLPAPDDALPRKFFIDEFFKAQKPVTEDLLISIKGAAYKQLAGEFVLLPSHEDALNILDTVLNWRPPAQEASNPFDRTEIIKKRIAREAGPCLFFAIAPALLPDDITDTRVDGLFRAIKELPAPSLLQILPKCVALRPELEERVYKIIRRLLMSSRFDDVSAASAAMVRWAEQPSQGPTLPRALIDQLIFAIETRQEGSLPNLLWTARKLLLRGKCTTNDKTALIDALLDLYSEISYQTVEAAKLRVSLSLVRAECVKLAKQLSDLGLSRQGITVWLESYCDDPLPEVRFALHELTAEAPQEPC